MSDIASWIISHVVNPPFFSGLVCGVSVAWFLLGKAKVTTKIKFSPENSFNSNEPEGDGDDNYKLVLIVRSDLKMGKGKAAAQCSHAAVMAYQQALRQQPIALKEWEECGQAKVVLKVETESELLQLATAARSAGLITSLVRDAGRTQIAPGSKTVLGIALVQSLLWTKFLDI